MKFKLPRLLSVLFVKEYNCLICGRELPKPNRYSVCNSCYAKQEVIGDNACLKCGKMLFAEEQYCLDCQNHEKEFDRAFAPLCYSGGAATTVMNLKFHGKKYLAKPMAKWMTDKFLETGLIADVVIPVPLHSRRKKERGFNQSELLASEIAASLALPLDATSACRVKDTLVSSKLTGGRKAREENMKDAFSVTDKETIKEKRVLVVDDVLTTGTTANELSKALKKAGAKKVYVLTFATTREKPPIQEES